MELYVGFGIGMLFALLLEYCKRKGKQLKGGEKDMPKKKKAYTFKLSDGGKLTTMATTKVVAVKKARQWQRGKYNKDKVKVKF